MFNVQFVNTCYHTYFYNNNIIVINKYTHLFNKNTVLFVWMLSLHSFRSLTSDCFICIILGRLLCSSDRRESKRKINLLHLLYLSPYLLSFIYLFMYFFIFTTLLLPISTHKIVQWKHENFNFISNNNLTIFSLNLQHFKSAHIQL